MKIGDVPVEAGAQAVTGENVDTATPMMGRVRAGTAEPDLDTLTAHLARRLRIAIDVHFTMDHLVLALGTDLAPVLLAVRHLRIRDNRNRGQYQDHVTTSIACRRSRRVSRNSLWCFNRT